jgi:hypothetical protein
MLVLLSFVSGVAAMGLYRWYRPVPIFRQDAADLAIKYLLDLYTKEQSPEERAASEPALLKNFNTVIDAYSYMRQHLK